MSVGGEGGGVSSGAPDHHFVNQQGGWIKNGSDPDSAHEQSFIVKSTARVTIPNGESSLDFAVNFDLGIIDEYIPQATLFQNYQFKGGKILMVLNSLRLGGSTGDKINPGKTTYDFYIAPWNRPFAISSSKDLSGWIGNVPGCQYKVISCYPEGGDDNQDVLYSAQWELLRRDSMVKASIDNPMYGIAAQSTQDGDTTGVLMSGAPLPILTELGEDSTIWNCFRCRVQRRNTIEYSYANSVDLDFDVIWNVVIRFTGIRWSGQNLMVSRDVGRSIHYNTRDCKSSLVRNCAKRENNMSNTLQLLYEPFQKNFHHYPYLLKAIKKSGSIKARISKALIQGPARVGKTSLKCLILSQRYNSEASTGIAERPQVAVGDFSMSQFGQVTENRWELVDNNNLIEMFAKDIESLYEIELSGNSKHEMVMKSIKTEIDQDNSVDLQPSTASSDPFLTLNSNVAAKRLSQILSKASSKANKLSLYKNWLYFIDSGGQIQFQQILQAFIPCASILMLVISLADDLSCQSSTELLCEDRKRYIGSTHSLSIETLLKRLISLVNFSSQQGDVTNGNEHLSAAIKPPDKLRIITIATHLDIYNEREGKGEISETINVKEARLKQIFQSVEGNISYQNPVSGKVLFVVDGRKASQGIFDDQVIKDIHAELSKQAFEVDIPLKWYAFEILLRDKACHSCGVLTLEDCISCGFELGLEEGEAESALKFFHLLNTILYYPEEVTNLVFVDPHSLIQVINELMVLVCKIRNGVNVGCGTLALPEIANFGIISSDVFSQGEHLEMFVKISRKFGDFKSHLFNILTRLLIAKQLPGNKSLDAKYFVPALLPLIDPLEAMPFKCIPLLLYFKTGAPVGLFCALIVNLLSSKVCSGDDEDDELYDDCLWELDTKSTPKMYSNSIILQNRNLMGRIGLVESSDCFEIHCECREDQLDVKKAIKTAIKETAIIRSIGSGLRFELAFFCPCSKPPHRHLGILMWKKCELCCELGGSYPLPKDPSYMSWITSTKNESDCNELPLTGDDHTEKIYDCPKLYDKPNQLDLLNKLVPIDSKWWSIGKGLGVSHNDLTSLTESNMSNQVKLGHVLDIWIKMDSQVTWKTILDVLMGPLVENKTLAKEIYQYLKQESPKQEKATNTQSDECGKEEDIDFGMTESTASKKTEGPLEFPVPLSTHDGNQEVNSRGEEATIGTLISQSDPKGPSDQHFPYETKNLPETKKESGVSSEDMALLKVNSLPQGHVVFNTDLKVKPPPHTDPIGLGPHQDFSFQPLPPTGPSPVDDAWKYSRELENMFQNEKEENEKFFKTKLQKIQSSWIEERQHLKKRFEDQKKLLIRNLEQHNEEIDEKHKEWKEELTKCFGTQKLEQMLATQQEILMKLQLEEELESDDDVILSSVN